MGTSSEELTMPPAPGWQCLRKLMSRVLQVYKFRLPFLKRKRGNRHNQCRVLTERILTISVWMGECSRGTLPEAAFSPCFSVIEISEKRLPPEGGSCFAAWPQRHR